MPEDHEPCEESHPTYFQKRTLWTAITAISLVIIAAISVGAIILGGKVLGFLQPFLVPIAVSAIVAYLLQPIIIWLRVKTRIKYRAAMLIVYISFLVAIVLLAISVILPSLGQAQEIIRDWETIQYKITDVSKRALEHVQNRFDHPMVQKYSREYYDSGIELLSEEGPKIGKDIWDWVWEKLLGGIRVFGPLLFGMILVPLYLFFFLKESHKIKRSWSNYLPLRASKFKDELVDTLQEINQYLISFFRGQMVVSLIDGVLVAVALALILKLPYAPLIGVFLAILGLIPYIGNLMVMVPAIIIAIVHFADTTWVPIDVDSQIKAGEVHLIQLKDDNSEKKKYVSDVETVTRVKAKLADGTVVQAFVPYQKTEDEKEIARETPIGETLDVRTEKGIVKPGTILEVLATEKKAAVLTNAWSFLPHIWVYPLIVLAIFLILQQINGLVTAPMIVGDSVGLHPFTVILSVIFWSFLLGGLLGALLAVPLTASIKVLFRRYIWNSRLESRVGPLGESEETDLNISTEDKKS